MIDMLISLFILPMDHLRLSQCEMVTSLNYHRRLARLAEPEVESSCGQVHKMLLVSDAPKARYLGYVSNGRQVIENVSIKGKS